MNGETVRSFREINDDIQLVTYIMCALELLYVFKLHKCKHCEAQFYPVWTNI